MLPGTCFLATRQHGFLVESLGKRDENKWRIGEIFVLTLCGVVSGGLARLSICHVDS